MFKKIKEWLDIPAEIETVKSEEAVILSSKEQATLNKEPWVAVIDTKINPNNLRNGFFELDWNEFFITELKSIGYYGENEEEIVEKWFQDLCKEIGNEDGLPMMDRRFSGRFDTNKLRD